MEVNFGDDQLDRLETDPGFTAGLPQQIVTAFRKRMQIIRSAPDEREFYKFKSLHFEKLKGARKHQHSMRLNDRQRLILEFIKQKQGGKIIKIMGIEDYH